MMILSRKTWEDERTARIRAEERAAAVATQNTALQVTMDWMRVSIRQLEHERAIMMERYMGIKVMVKDIEVATDSDSSILSELPDFNDMGDEAAKKAGIEWNDIGEVVTSGKK